MAHLAVPVDVTDYHVTVYVDLANLMYAIVHRTSHLISSEAEDDLFLLKYIPHQNEGK